MQQQRHVLIRRQRGAVNHERISAVRADGVEQAVRQTGDDNPRGGNGIGPDVRQQNGLLDQSVLMIHDLRGIRDGHERAGQISDCLLYTSRAAVIYIR